jgi:hypothetical protein
MQDRTVVILTGTGLNLIEAACGIGLTPSVTDTTSSV